MAAAEATARRPLFAALLNGLTALFGAGVGHLEWRSAQRAGAALGTLAWRVARRDKRRTLEHLEIAFPGWPGEQRWRIGRASFVHLGTMLGECLWLGKRDPGDIFRHLQLDGWHEVEIARAARRPILILTGHCGNWELLAAALNVRGLGMSVVARELDDPGLQQTLLGLRSRFGTRTIVRGRPGSARALLTALRGGGALGMLIDQDTKVEGVWVDFFARRAWTPVGAAELARRFDAAVLPTFIERRADGTHAARIHPALDLASDPVAATQAMTATIEAQIRRVPEQWVWLHRRWRRQPESP